MRSLQFRAAVNRIKCLPRSEASRTGAQIAKQRTIFTEIIQRVKRDAGSVWSSEFIDSFTAGAASKPIPEDALAMLGDGFLPTMQYEEYVSTIIRAVCDELEASDAERRILERRCLSGLDSGLHDGLFSALDDEPEVCALAVRLLAAMCGNRSEVERTRTKKGLRLRVTLAADEDYLGAIQALPLSLNAPVMCISAASICQMVQLPFGSEGRFGSNSAPLVHYAYKHVVATLLRIPVPEQWSASRCFAYDKTQELYDEKRKRKGSKAPGRPAADLAEAAGKMILASLELAEEVDAA